MASDDDTTVTILTRDGIVIEVDNSMLCKESETFLHILASDDYDGRSRIRVKEDYKRFSTLINFMKGRAIEIRTFHDAFEIYKLCKRYKIKLLEEDSKNYIMASSTEFITKIYDAAVRFGDLEFEYYCWKQFRKFTDQRIRGEDFIYSGKKTIERFVNCPIYSNLSEVSLFRGLYEWARMRVLNNGFLPEAKLIRYEMEPFLSKIRFLSMTREEIEEIVQTKILKDNEIEEIMSKTISPITSLPASICQNDKKRTLLEYSNLFRYYNKHGYPKSLERLLTKKDMFFCELSVTSRAFPLKFLLPINHCNPAMLLVNINFYKLKKLKTIHLVSTTGHSSQNGEINLYSPVIALESASHYLITVKFSPNMIDPENKITIMRTAQYYIKPDDTFEECSNRLCLFTELYF
ncbi:uncharacterized protein LOC111639644 [Centruroides sculpturatus]|uniref:uncharacterized protein LOC111639644 n=1 Tax=Centruroides sculpturatus TaxID=218467 RepID=UPI000C6C9241|nr:uncharacterized protein LOC111639644 [Centruroides sculpturatus]